MEEKNYYNEDTHDKEYEYEIRQKDLNKELQRG